MKTLGNICVEGAWVFSVEKNLFQRKVLARRLHQHFFMKRRSQIKSKEFEEQILPHTGEFFKQAMFLTRDKDDAADLVQDALLRAFDAWESFEPGTSGRRWLSRILRNSFYSKCRRKTREKQWLADRACVAHSLHSGGLRRSNCSPEVTASEDVLKEEVDRAFSDLPREFRRVLELYCMEGLSYKEIAGLIKCPVGTVMSRIHRARQRLKESIEQSGGFGLENKPDRLAGVVDSFLVAA